MDGATEATAHEHRNKQQRQRMNGDKLKNDYQTTSQKKKLAMAAMRPML